MKRVPNTPFDFSEWEPKGDYEGLDDAFEETLRNFSPNANLAFVFDDEKAAPLDIIFELPFGKDSYDGGPAWLFNLKELIDTAVSAESDEIAGRAENNLKFRKLRDKGYLRLARLRDALVSEAKHIDDFLEEIPK